MMVASAKPMAAGEGGERGDPYVTETDPALAYATARLLASAFPWHETAEGFEFWSKVHHRLMEIAGLTPPAQLN